MSRTGNLLLAAALLAPALFAEELPPPATRYMGRAIAQTMSYHGAPWLVRPERDAEENTALLLKALDVRPGQIVADIGCGNGFYTLELARRVGPEGRVYAVDIQPEMLALLQERAAAAGLKNIVSVLGGPADPRLPEAAIDLVLLVDVYHEFAYPERMLAAMRRSLAPGGRIALAEYRLEDPRVPIKLDHKMGRKQILKEYGAAGFRLEGEFEGLPWQHLLFLERAD